MEKRKLNVLGLSYSQSNDGSCVVILSDEQSKLKLPVIVKPIEAHRIVLEVEKIKPPRTMMHDFVKNMTDVFNIQIREIYIHSILEGIYYTKIIATNDIEEIEIECSTGDAISLSMIYKCPIFASAEVLKNAGVAIEDDGTPIPDEELSDDELANYKKTKKSTSVEDLNKLMEEAIHNEEYELAAKLRDRIEELENS